MDQSAGTGLIGAALIAARSFQPNLLTRRSTDQAIITGVTSASAYGVFSAGDAILNAVAFRFGRSEQVSPFARLAVASAAGAVGAAVATALSWREHEESKRAVGRLLARSAVAISAASALSTFTHSTRPNAAARATVAVAALVGGASFALTKPWQARPGSRLDDAQPGAVEQGKRYFFEDTVRRVSVPKSLGIAVGVAAATYGLARVESRLTAVSSHLATMIIGGAKQDHRRIGRVASAAITVGTGWFAVAKVSTLLAKGGGSLEPAYATAPAVPEISGSPASGLDWNKMTREGTRWLAATLPPSTIAMVMGITDAKQPIRVYASLEMAANGAQRAQILLAEIDRTHALDRSIFALFSPTGSGYVNYVATETLEYLTGGDCASAAIQYSVLPSALSLTRVPSGTSQTALVLRGIVQRLMQMPADKRPRVVLFGESLGSEVSEEMFRGLGVSGLVGSGLDAALWIGTPAATKWRGELWGSRTIAEAPEVGPGTTYLPRSIADWRALPRSERDQVRFLLLQNGDDPIPKFGSQVAWRRPDWLGPDDTRPIGSPKGTQWVAGMTFLTTFFDMQNALVPTPGTFCEGGHDYREVLPEAISATWQLPATDEQFTRINAALRSRELAWELHRDWTHASSQPATKQDAAKAKVLTTASRYIGSPIDAIGLQAIVKEGLEFD